MFAVLLIKNCNNIKKISQIAQTSTELLTTADLLKTHNQLEYLRDKINQDSNLKEKQQIAQALITNIFVNAF